jgi:hypothetical protein
MSTTITLEGGFTRLDEIIEELPDATVEASLDLIAEGHGIHRALDTRPEDVRDASGGDQGRPEPARLRRRRDRRRDRACPVGCRRLR